MKAKPTTLKQIVVECRTKTICETGEFEIDADIFDDIYLEAATRFVDGYVKKPEAKMPPILTAYEKSDTNNVNKHYCFNSYYVIVNAGFYKKAEMMRQNFKNITNIDLKFETLKSPNGRNH
jgi:hypothetical protein